MKIKYEIFASKFHNLLIVFLCIISLLCYIFLNTESIKHGFFYTYASAKELRFSDTPQEFDKMPSKSIVNFIFEQTKETFSQIISKRSK